MWADLTLVTNPDGTWSHLYSAVEYMPNIVGHEEHTHGGALNGYIALKILTPWLMEEKSGIKFNITSPVWNNLDKLNMFTTLPGTVDFKYQNTVNNIMVISRRRNEITWQCGEPFLHIMPLTEKEVNVVCHVVDKQEYDDRYLAKMYRSSFISTYQKSKARCPFHRGEK
jgi:hypothetical protein